MITRSNHKIKILIFDLFFHNRISGLLNKSISIFNFDHIFLKNSLSLCLDPLPILLPGSLLTVTLYEKLDSLANGLNHEFYVTQLLVEVFRVQVVHSQSVENALEELPQNHFLDFRFLAPTADLFQLLQQLGVAAQKRVLKVHVGLVYLRVLLGYGV
jgi:hypothetical protein